MDELKVSYPNHVFVKIHKVSSCNLPELQKEKFIISKYINLSQLNFILRKKLKLDSTQALFLFCGNKIPVPHTTIDELWITYPSDDDFLHIQYSSENTFG